LRKIREDDSVVIVLGTKKETSKRVVQALRGAFWWGQVKFFVTGPPAAAFRAAKRSGLRGVCSNKKKSYFRRLNPRLEGRFRQRKGIKSIDEGCRAAILRGEPLLDDGKEVEEVSQQRSKPNPLASLHQSRWAYRTFESS